MTEHLQSGIRAAFPRCTTWETTKCGQHTNCRFRRRGFSSRFRRRGFSCIREVYKLRNDWDAEKKRAPLSTCSRSGTEWVARIRYPIIRTIILTSFTLSQFIVHHFLESAQSVAVLSTNCNRFLIRFWMGTTIRSGATWSIHFAAANCDIVCMVWRGNVGLIPMVRNTLNKIARIIRVPVTVCCISDGNIMVRSCLKKKPPSAKWQLKKLRGDIWHEMILRHPSPSFPLWWDLKISPFSSFSRFKNLSIF